MEVDEPTPTEGPEPPRGALRPRERLREQGVGALSDAELLALVLGSGVPGRSATRVGRHLARRHPSELASWPLARWLAVAGVGPARASLVSYDIFGDSIATQRLLLYTRKMINMLNDDGTPKMDINKPSASTLKARREVQNPIRFSLDTLGVDTVMTPKGTFKPVKVLMKQGTGATQSVGDSSIYTEVRENRTSWYTLDVPITHLAREDIESINAHKSWLIGRSGDATPLAIRDRGLGSARLIDFGRGATARLVPERLRHTIAEQEAAERAAAKPATSKGTTAKPASTKSSTKTAAAGTKPQ